MTRNNIMSISKLSMFADCVYLLASRRPVKTNVGRCVATWRCISARCVWQNAYIFTVFYCSFNTKTIYNGFLVIIKTINTHLAGMRKAECFYFYHFTFEREH